MELRFGDLLWKCHTLLGDDESNVAFTARIFVHEECLDPKFVDIWNVFPDSSIPFMVGNTAFSIKTHGYEPVEGSCPCCTQELKNTTSIECYIRCDANSVFNPLTYAKAVPHDLVQESQAESMAGSKA